MHRSSVNHDGLDAEKDFTFDELGINIVFGANHNKEEGISIFDYIEVEMFTAVSSVGEDGEFIPF